MTEDFENIFEIPQDDQDDDYDDDSELSRDDEKIIQEIMIGNDY